MVYEFPATLNVIFRITAATKAEAEGMLRAALVNLDNAAPTVDLTEAIAVVLKPALLTEAAAKKQILAKWPEWLQANPMNKPNGNHGMFFFTFLQKEHPDLLLFNVYGDPWQTVHSFLLRAHLVSD